MSHASGQTIVGSLGRLSHIAVLVRDLPAAIQKYQTLFGATLVEQETLPSGADVSVVELGGVRMEFLSTRQPGSKVAKLLDELGEGIHHLSCKRCRTWRQLWNV